MTTSPAFHRRNPFPAPLLKSWSLTKQGSAKDTRHFELSLHGSGLTFEPGDSLGIFPSNSPHIVEELVARLGINPDQTVTTVAGPTTFRHALESQFILNRANRKILHGIAERLPASSAADNIRTLLLDDARTAEYLFSRDFIDILAEHPSAQFESPEAFIKMLSPIQPRLYSIASSPEAHPGEVHLCVGVVRYETNGRKKVGLASGYLADQIRAGVDRVPVYVQESAKFKLPIDTDRDIIMVGPGTGIAPFRAFLERRVGQGAKGRNWLFFGEQHHETDFLYGSELEHWNSKGQLHRLDLAFSRDQAEKIYVQHRMWEKRSELWTWIRSGAYFYVCGDARRMAKDVHSTLIRIASDQGGLDMAGATHFVETIFAKEEKRYLKDVY